jgi:molybdenum cofactor cytidylyltransferase
MGCLLKANGLYSRTTVGAVLLAAGAGSRLGGRPKALLELGGVPLVLRQLVALSGAGVDEVVVVLGHHADAVEAAVRAFPITLARNPSPDDGQASSVRIGLKALSPKIDAVIVALADQPLINEQDVTGADGEGLPGNPVIFEAALRDEWLAGDVDAACRRWRQDNPNRVRWLDTDNRRYRIDIDTPADIERFAASTGHTLSWPAPFAS